MLRLPTYEVRMTFSQCSVGFQQVFVGCPTTDDVIEAVKLNGFNKACLELLELVGLPDRVDKEEGSEDWVRTFNPCGVYVGVIRVIPSDYLYTGGDIRKTVDKALECFLKPEGTQDNA
jgi:hypothetical protein